MHCKACAISLCLSNAITLFLASEGGGWFPVEHLAPREGFGDKALAWRLQWPKYIIDRLVTSANLPNGAISNSDLELAGGLLYVEALAQSFVTQEQTVLRKTNNHFNMLF